MGENTEEKVWADLWFYSNLVFVQLENDRAGSTGRLHKAKKRKPLFRLPTGQGPIEILQIVMSRVG